MASAHPVAGPCGAKNRKGTPCQRPAGWGTSHHGTGRCRFHGGASPQAEVSGAVTLARREMMVMGRPLDLEPHEALLECIRISAGEVQYASDRIAELAPDEAVGRVVVTTRRPLKEEKGAEDPSVQVEETRLEAPALHIWIVVRQHAMDRLVNYSKIALAAGVQERQVRAAERYASAIADAMRRMAESLGFDPADPKVREAMRGSLTLIAGGSA